MSDNVGAVDLVRKLLIAIDFGTTWSSVAWCQTAKPDIQTIITQWPHEHDSIDGATSEAVPTELLYERDGRTYRWGFQIKENEPRIQRFKLELNPDRGREVSYLSFTYPDLMAMPPDYSKKGTDLTRDFLTKLHQHVMAVLRSKLGSAVVSTTPIEYVLTVPAIWKERAKEATRACAEAAGINVKIHMISEPEAAVTYALHAMDAGTLSEGDLFVVCDAGGGTVDLISYIIDDTGEGKMASIREAASGTGDLCGSSFLNNGFRDFLLDRFADEIKSGEWDEDTLEEAMQRFEKITKRQFHGEEREFIVPVPGLADNPSKGVKRARLTLTLKEMLSIFKPIVCATTVLVMNQIRATDGEVKAVLLVGGFGQSPYLKRMIQKVVGPKIEVLQPANGWTAVVRGALMRGLALSSDDQTRVTVTSRVSRKSFGVSSGTNFDFKIHRRALRYSDPYFPRYRVQAMNWLIKKGDTLKETEPVALSFFRKQKTERGRFKQVTDYIHVYDGLNAESPPVHEQDGCHKHTTLTSDLSSIPLHKLELVEGDDGHQYYKIAYEIRAQFFSAHTEYSVWHDGIRYGSAKANYE